jgi:alkylated DNA nucleotide flippase Atl1
MHINKSAVYANLKKIPKGRVTTYACLAKILHTKAYRVIGQILKKNPDKINWVLISLNPNIFELDYGFLRKRMDIIREELMMKAWHPLRVMKWVESGLDMEDL